MIINNLYSYTSHVTHRLLGIACLSKWQNILYILYNTYMMHALL